MSRFILDTDHEAIRVDPLLRGCHWQQRPVTELPIAVLDASVLVPRRSRLVPQRLAAAQPPRYTAVWSTAIVAETWRILTEQRLWAGDAPAAISRDAHRMHARLDPVPRVVECWRRPDDAPPSPLPDPHDEHLWNAALLYGQALPAGGVMRSRRSG